MDTPVRTPSRADAPPVAAAPRPAPAEHERHAAFWSRGAPGVADITLPLPDLCIDEIEAALRRLPRLVEGEQPDEATLTRQARETLPRTRVFAAEVRERLEHGPGVAIVERFPAERWSDADNRHVAGLFSTLVSPLKAQTFDGTTLYDVMDKKVEDVSRVRRSITNLAQAYHTDGPWFAVPARYIGLYCIRNAGQGGHSRVTSLLAAVDTLREEASADVVAELGRAHPWDRQGEHAPDDAPFERHPIAVENEAGLVARFYESYVRRGYELAGERPSAAADEALAALSRVLDGQPSVRFLMEPGQLQYANNYTVVHAREAFEDEAPESAPTSGGGRRLVRVWHH